MPPSNAIFIKLIISKDKVIRMPKLGVSSRTLRLVDVGSDTSRKLSKLGIDVLEINLNFFPITWRESKHERIRNVDMEIALHSSSTHVDPVNPDPLVAQTSLNMLRCDLKIADKLDATHFITHVSSYHSTLERNVEALREVKRYADKFSIPMLYENSSKGIGSSERDIEFILDELDVNLALDLGHLWVSVNSGTIKRMKDFFAMFSDKIEYCHIHDNSGKSDTHSALGKGTLPIELALDLLLGHEVKYWVIEVNGSDGLSDSLDIIKNYSTKLS